MLSLCPVDPWSKIRPLLLPAFSTGNLRKMNPIIRECARNTAQRLVNLAEKQDDVDAERIFGHYTAEVTAYCAFGVPVDYADMDEFVRMIVSKKMPPTRQAFCDLFPFVAKMLKIGNRDTRYAHFAGRLAKRLIQRRLGSTYCRCLKVEVVCWRLMRTFLKQSVTMHLSENEMLAQCALYLLAGTETPLVPLSAAVRLLAKHPDIQCELRNEVDHCVARNESEPSFEEINKLPYLNAVIRETLRINPPVSRFLHGDNETVRRYAYLPFGVGPRACIAARFALHAMKVCLFEAIRNVEFVKYSSHAKIYSQHSESIREDDVLQDMRLKVKRRM
ncbi:hypothetical protein HPB50_014074 [Hyalomma asiaticum]|uniref:Uncharacterized protein n=1 Tax=Hyalomma asiaticum TaxID=266040 RepID=A0ACB7S780_HYAAI|nr:hypothetical protein HPB50_014074 [Hyalomma asiaticum]